MRAKLHSVHIFAAFCPVVVPFCQVDFSTKIANDPNSAGTPIFDSSFDPTSKAAQVALGEFCTKTLNHGSLRLSPVRVSCFIDSFKSWLATQGISWPCLPSLFAKYLQQFKVTSVARNGGFQDDFEVCHAFQALPWNTHDRSTAGIGKWHASDLDAAAFHHPTEHQSAGLHRSPATSGLRRVPSRSTANDARRGALFELCSFLWCLQRNRLKRR